MANGPRKGKAASPDGLTESVTVPLTPGQKKSLMERATRESRTITNMARVLIVGAIGAGLDTVETKTSKSIR